MKVGNGIACGTILGTSKALNCCAHTKAFESTEKTKFYSGGEGGELFMHEGAPFPGQGHLVDRFPGDYINAIAICDESHRLFVGLSSKKLLVYDSETMEKVCEVDEAHQKGIYSIRVTPAGHEASILSCSADNTIKMWKMNEESKQLTELATIQQFEGAEESTERQLVNFICF